MIMINDKIKKALEDAKLIREESMENGDTLLWYAKPGGNLVIIQEYAKDRGCEVFLPVGGNDVDTAVSEIHGNKQLQMQWFVRTIGRWGKGDDVATAMDNSQVGPEDQVHLSVVSDDWELCNTFGTLSCKYGKHSKPFRMANFIYWEWLIRKASELCEANGLKSYAIDKLADKLMDLDMEEPGVKVPWITEEEGE